MASQKQRTAAKENITKAAQVAKNITKAAQVAKKRRTISRLPKATRTALGKQAASVAKKKRKQGKS
jgi:ABC-type bacteriocin/lantibiotic exporter with double-glycine peptidase domain